MWLILTLGLSFVSSVVGSLNKTELSECAGVVLSRDMLSFQSKHYHQGSIRVYGASSNVSDENYAPNVLLMTITLLPHSEPVVVTANRRPHVSVAFDVLKVEYELDSSINDRREGVYYFRPTCRSTLKPSSLKMGSLGTLFYACDAYERHPSCAQEGYVSKLYALHEQSALSQILECEHDSNQRLPQVIQNNNQAWNEGMRYFGELFLLPLKFLRDIGMGWNHVAASANDVMGMSLKDNIPLREGTKKKDDTKKVNAARPQAPAAEPKVETREVKTPQNERHFHDCHGCDHHRRLKTNFSDLSVNNIGEAPGTCKAIEVLKDSISFMSHYHANGIARIYAVTNDPSDHHYAADKLLFTYTVLPQSTPRIFSREGLSSAPLSFNLLRVQYDFDSSVMADRRQGGFIFTPHCVDAPERFPVGAIGYMQYQCKALPFHPSCTALGYEEKYNEVRLWSAASQMDMFTEEGTPKAILDNRRAWREALENVIWFISVPFRVFDYLGGTFNHVAHYVGMDGTKALRVDKK